MYVYGLFKAGLVSFRTQKFEGKDGNKVGVGRLFFVSLLLHSSKIINSLSHFA